MSKANKTSPITGLPKSAYLILMAYAQALNELTRTGHPDTNLVLRELKFVQARRDALIDWFTSEYPDFNSQVYYNFMQGICFDDRLSIPKDI
jgi:hypothetical protein